MGCGHKQWSDHRPITSTAKIIGLRAKRTTVVLGGVDGFEEDEAQSKGDEGAIIPVSLFAA